MGDSLAPRGACPEDGACDGPLIPVSGASNWAPWGARAAWSCGGAGVQQSQALTSARIFRLRVFPYVSQVLEGLEDIGALVVQIACLRLV